MDKPFKSHPKEGLKKKKCCSVDNCTRPIFSKGKCRTHWGYEYSRKKKEELKPIIEADTNFYNEIWSERPHVCSGCGDSLGATWKHWNFHHVELKSKRPDLRYDKNNLLLVCLQCHSNYHT